MIEYFKKMKKDPSMSVKRQRAMLKNVFSSLDKDCNGFIDYDELPGLSKALGATLQEIRGTPLTDNEFESIKKIADRNRDGKIDFEEFCNMIFTIRASAVFGLR